MYQVTELYKEKIKENVRTFKISIEIQHSAGTLTLSDEDIITGSLRLNESSQAGNDFTIGGVVASTLEFDIVNKTDSIHGTFLVDSLNIIVDDMLRTVDWYDEYSGINFEGATIIPQVGLLLSENPDVWEYVPLGRFNIDEVIKSRNTIRIKAIDNMIELDKPYSLSKLSYPASLYQIYMNICSVADVQPGTTSFTNQDYIVDERPEGDYTLRDILSYVAALSGNFARFNRVGSLELTWYEDVGLTLTGANRFDFKPREDLIQIKGVAYTTTDENGEEVTYLAGSDEYVVDLTNNPLLQNDVQTVISNIYEKVKTTVFTPYESRWQGNPAIQTGDKIIQIDRDGNEFETIVTHSTYRYRGASTLAARGLPIKAKRYRGSTDRKIAEIKRKVEKDVGDKLTSLEQAQLNVTELIANMLGGYVIKTDDAIYIADNPDIEQAMKVWKWGLGGFGYSENGVEGPYTTGISADGTIVAMLVAANIITADMIKTGILSSEDDSTWINLNDGTFNFKEVLQYTEDDLRLISNHSDGSYTSLSSEGLRRHIGSTGVDYHYLTYVGTGDVFQEGSGTGIHNIEITLPDEFKGKDFKAHIALSWTYVWDSLFKAGWVEITGVDYEAATISIRVIVSNAMLTGGTNNDIWVGYQYIVIA
jgi:hypothetical protein